MSARAFVSIVMLLCLAPAGAEEPQPAVDPRQTDQASPPADVAPAPSAEPYDTYDAQLAGDGWGVRPLLDEQGLTIDLSLTAIYQHNARGGVQTRDAHRVSGSYDLELLLDFGRLGLWDDASLYSLAEGSWDEGISDRGYVGDLFGANGDAAGDRSIDVTELWYEHTFLDDRLRIRAGKIDLSVDFETNWYANDEGGQFLNNGLINAANVPFPDNGLGIQFIATPLDWLYFGAGVADAEADARETGLRTAFHGRDDLFSIYEIGFTPTIPSSRGELPGNYRFGLWYDPQPKEKFFDDLDGRRRTVPLKRDDVGFYTSMDQLVFRENPGAEGDLQGLGVFFRYAYARGDVNELEHFWSAGGQYLGLIPQRDADVLGFGVAQGLLSEGLRLRDADPHRETALELYYSVQVLPSLYMTPDLQWILRPGGEDGRDAFVAGLRLQVAF